MMSAQPVVAPQRRASGYATASLVLGVVGVVFGWCILGLPSVVAIMLGHMALGDIRKHDLTGRTQAVIGLTLGYAMMAVVLLGIFGYLSSLS